MIHRIHNAVFVTLIALTICFYLTARSMAATTPTWPASSVIYCVYTSIFSPKGDFAGVTAQLGRLKSLGVNVVWLMPVTPVGKPINGHPAIGSPYCVHDYFAVNPECGSPSDLKTLVATAHKMGMSVILDEVLNHTSWDNALLTQHPDYYDHGDGNPKNPASIRQAFNFSDVAQLNYADPGLRTYVVKMLQFWLSRYGVDGFRFDTADDPDGLGRKIPADFWQDLGRQLHRTHPGVLLLGECETPDLALKPFALDYGWHMYGAVKDASNGGSASQVEDTWQHQTHDFPQGMKHMSIQDDWDDSRDVNTFGGKSGAMAVAAFNFTQTGVPMIYNGMEIGNASGGVNPHAPIDWKSGNRQFPVFYRKLIALRRENPALTQGAMTWLTNSVPSQVLTYERTGGGAEFLVEINLSSAAATGTVKAPAGAGWAEISLPGAQRIKTHAAPPQVSLQPKEFAIFKRPLHA